MRHQHQSKAKIHRFYLRLTMANLFFPGAAE
uniref:Uncharacterized protein n=1 Tax=Arundo donax TaxID=35708 RepID=A0A0A9EPL0_ARUDO